MMTWKRFSRSLHYAQKGIRYAILHEQSFRLHLVAAGIVLGMMFLFPLERLERVILFFTIVLILVLEIVNTIFERLIDVLKPRVHFYAEVIKDLMAAAVLIAAVGSIVVGLVIFFPYLFAFVNTRFA